MDVTETDTAGQPEKLLLFQVEQQLFATTASTVIECMMLPALSAVDTTLPHYIAGLLSLRGRVVAVVDMARRLGHPGRPLHANQSLLVIATKSQYVAIIVDTIEGVIEAPQEDQQLNLRQLHHEQYHFGDRVSSTAAGIVTLIDADLLLDPDWELPCDCDNAIVPTEPKAQQIDPASIAIMQQRQQRLLQTTATEAEQQQQFAIVRIGSDHYGLLLQDVIGFATISALTTIPCCPAHIAGTITYRGMPLPLLDIMPLLHNETAERAYSHMAIVPFGNHRLAIALHEVVTIRSIALHQYEPLPAAMHGSLQHYYFGATYQQQQSVLLLDIARLLQSPTVIVNEQVN